MKRVVLLVIAALGLGIFAAYGSYQVQTQAEERALARFETTDVLVTTMEIPALTSIADAKAAGMIETVKYPTEYLPLAALRPINTTFSNDLASEALPAGHLILDGDFGLLTDRGSSIILPAGFTALSLELSMANRVGGFLQPGREVAVIYSGPGFAADTGKVVSRTLFTGVRVLAVGTNTVSGLSLNPGSDAAQNVVTLAIRPEDVVELLNAVESGTISLVLLSQGTEVPIEEVTSR